MMMIMMIMMMLMMTVMYKSAGNDGDDGITYLSIYLPPTCERFPSLIIILRANKVETVSLSLSNTPRRM